MSKKKITETTRVNYDENNDAVGFSFESTEEHTERQKHPILWGIFAIPIAIAMLIAWPWLWLVVGMLVVLGIIGHVVEKREVRNDAESESE